ncbi:hypothetical protein S40285_10348 [Stachybotrys chlorohalonatus IBT 40285]|uniref:Uncharacterized protein n=1 Tax=Stachybotrys chlorohalonatus (strain IBT 40285) TaxID=1283841 RepID=A0A084R0G3_STAC4|nr:hypothetical protein S40285_10348 [Stachybotrys chlorohalonata IBT 40285]
MATETVVMIKSILKPTRPVEVDWVNVPGSMLRQSSNESSTTSSRNGSDKSNGSGDDASSDRLARDESIQSRHVSDATTTDGIPKKAAKRVTFPKVPWSVIVYEPLESETDSFSHDGDSDANSEDVTNARRGLITSGSHIELRDEAKFRAGSTSQTGHRDLGAISRRHYNHDALLSARLTARDHLRVNFAGVSVAPEVLFDFDIPSTSCRCFEIGADDCYRGSKDSPDSVVRHVNGVPLVEPSTMSPSFYVNLPVISPLDPMSLIMLPSLDMDVASGLPGTRFPSTSTPFVRGGRGSP